MARELGIPYYLHPADNVWPYDGTPGRLDFTPLSDGTQIAIGDRPIRVFHTPGHTEGSVTFLLGDPGAESAAFTGDFLFVDSIGRPDLAGKMDAWIGDLWDSLERARKEWSANARLLPAHYGREDERNPDRSVDRSFREARDGNATLRISDADEFRDWVESHVSTPPATYPHIKAINVGLAEVTPQQADVLEAGKNECAVG